METKVITPEKFDAILSLLSFSDIATHKACTQCGSSAYELYEFLKRNKRAANRYARAKQLQAQFMAEAIIEIADDSSGDAIQTNLGRVENKEFTSRSRLRIDARKWLASKLYPKVYGAKVDMSSDGKRINPTIIVDSQETADNLDKLDNEDE
jgi:hypothetical protein